MKPNRSLFKENSPIKRRLWRVGKVLQVTKTPLDGRIRKATVEIQEPDGVTRVIKDVPVQHLAPLEC